MAFLATADAARSRTFYEGKLGLTLVNEDPFALVYDVNGTPLRIQRVEKVVVAPYTALGWRVADIARTVRALVAVGVHFVRYDGLEQDALGIWLSPSGTKVAWFKDPDGHTLSLSQS